MTPPLQTVRLALGAALLGLSLGVGAHGDEPHGHAPQAASHEPAAPRFESATETFEIVGRLEAGALMLFVQRFATSEPVSQAQVEIESGARKAMARYDATKGAYEVSEAAWVQPISQPGTHTLVISVLAGTDADLLEATLQVQTRAPAVQAAALPWPSVTTALALALALTLALGLAALLLKAFQRRRTQGARP